MSKISSILATTAAAAALLSVAGVANATTASTTQSYIASTTAPASLSIPGTVTLNNTESTDSGTNYATLFSDGNQVTFTLSQGTFASAPTIVGTSVTATFATGGAGSNFITYTLSGTTSGARTLTLSNISVNGLTNVADSGTSTPTSLSVAVTSNVSAFNAVPTAQRTTAIATFRNPISAALSGGSPFNVDVSGTATVASTIAAGTFGTVTYTALAGMTNYSNTALTFGAPTITYNIPFTAGSLASLALSGDCLTATITRTPTSATPISASNAVANTATAALSGPGGTCTLLGTPTGAASGTAPVIAAGPGQVISTFPITNGPAGATSQTVTTSLNTLTYTGGRVIPLQYVVGSDANYGFFVNVNNTNSTSARINVSFGNFSATVGTNVPAGGSRLIDIADIRAALIAAGAPSTTLADSSSRGRLQVITPIGVAVTPLLLNRQSGLVTEVGHFQYNAGTGNAPTP